MPSRIGDALHWYATYTPNKIAIVSSEGAQTYAQLWSRVCRLGSALAELGLVPGDRIALLMQNSSRYLEVYQAAALMGVAVVPLNFRFTASEIEYVVNHSGARALLFDDCLRRNRPVAANEAALRRRALCRHRWTGGSRDTFVRSPDRRGTRDAALHAGRSLRLLLPGLYIGHDRLSEGVRQSASRVRRLPAQDRNDLRHHRGRSGTGRRAPVPRSAGVVRAVADFPRRHRHRDERQFAGQRFRDDRSRPRRPGPSWCRPCGPPWSPAKK